MPRVGKHTGPSNAIALRQGTAAARGRAAVVARERAAAGEPWETALLEAIELARIGDRAGAEATIRHAVHFGANPVDVAAYFADLGAMRAGDDAPS